MTVKKKEGVAAPRCFQDYDVVVNRSLVPAGVELLELPGDIAKL